MDWNWFFSALAQSTAAIVGIFAAFIITKIINNQSEFKKKYSQLNSLLANCYKLVDKINSRYVEWYNKHTREEQLEEILHLISKNDSDDPEFYYNELNFSIYDDKNDIIEIISSKIKEFRIPKISTKNKIFNTPSRFKIPMPIIPMSDSMMQQEAKFRESLRNEKELIEDVVMEIKHQVRTIINFLLEVKGNPESSIIINLSIISILILFYTGVIYPLSFLPLNIDAKFDLSILAFFEILFSLKGIILFIISVIFNIIMIIFLVINIRLKYKKEEIEELEKYSLLKSYSLYLENMVNNLGIKIKKLP